MGFFSSSTAGEKFKCKKLKEEGCVVTLQIEVPAAKVQETTHNVLIRYQNQAKLPGFRPGKAPVEVVRKHLDDLVREKVVDQLIRESLPDVLKEQDLMPVDTPKIHSIQLDAGKPLVFQALIETSPKVQPKNYKKIPVAKKLYPATEEEMTKRLEELRESNARLERASQDALEKTHYAVIDYSASQNGKPLKNAKGQDELLDMSAPGTVEGLSEGLLGAKRGETRDIPVKIQGKPAAFRVTLKEIKTKILPSLDDELAKDLGYDSLLALRGKLRELVEEEGRRKTEREVLSQIEQHLLKANAFPVPPALIEDAAERTLERIKDQFLKTRRKWPEEEIEKLRREIRPKAEEEVRLGYLLRAIAQAEKIEVTAQELESEKENILKSAKSDEDRKRLEQLFEERKEGISAAILDRKVMDHVKDSAAITES